MSPHPLSPQDPRGLDGLDGLDVERLDAARLGEDLAAVTELVAAGVEVDGQVEIADGTWALYGHIGFGEAVVVGEYTDLVEARAVLRAAPYVAGGGMIR